MKLLPHTLFARCVTPRHSAEFASFGMEGELHARSLTAGNCTRTSLTCSLRMPADFFRTADGELIFSNPDNSCLIAVIPL